MTEITYSKTHLQVYNIATDDTQEYQAFDFRTQCQNELKLDSRIPEKSKTLL